MRRSASGSRCLSSHTSKILQNVASVPIIRLKYAFPMKSYVDLGYKLEFSWQTYAPQITEKTKLLEH
jgi:hypothetical protein